MPPKVDFSVVLDGALRRTVQEDEPVLATGKEGLFSSRSPKPVKAVLEGEGALFEPSAESPKHVTLTALGLAELVKLTDRDQIPELIKTSAARYRRGILLACRDSSLDQLENAKQNIHDALQDFQALRKITLEYTQSLHKDLDAIDQEINQFDEELEKLDLSNENSTQESSAQPKETPAPRPTNADDEDYRRNLAQELVFAWDQAGNQDAKDGMRQALLNSGAEIIGEPGVQVTFVGRHHKSEDPVFPGDTVEVVEPGWLIRDERGEYMLRKAIVKTI